MDKTTLIDIREAIYVGLERKTSWGRNELKEMISTVLLEVADGIITKQKNEQSPSEPDTPPIKPDHTYRPGPDVAYNSYLRFEDEDPSPFDEVPL